MEIKKMDLAKCTLMFCTSNVFAVILNKSVWLSKVKGDPYTKTKRNNYVEINCSDHPIYRATIQIVFIGISYILLLILITMKCLN
jgi:hypothetical protein